MSAFSFVIRDGLQRDIPQCLAIDSAYTTDYVWQMSIQHKSAENHQILFKTEHLPREMHVTYVKDERRLKLALTAEQCFLVAIGKEEPTLLGYLVMWQIPAHRLAIIQDIVVDRDIRRKRIGTRLLNVAKSWSREKTLTRMHLETQTKNYPAIAFIQNAGFSFCGYNDQYFTNQDIAVFFGQSLR